MVIVGETLIPHYLSITRNIGEHIHFIVQGWFFLQPCYFGLYFEICTLFKMDFQACGT